MVWYFVPFLIERLSRWFWSAFLLLSAHSTYKMREATVVDHTSIGLLQLELLSNDGDTFYARCMLNHRVIGVEHMASLSIPCIPGLSD